jgi:peptidoglycan/LPS O-acetylase OafA/YrhL
VNRPTSIYLDVVRPIAALFVLFSHVSFQNLSDGQLSILASMGVQAVDVFFVLSGFVIAHICSTRERNARDYFVSRAARIYSVAIPALILTAILDSIGQRESAATYEGPFQPLAPGLLIRSVLFMGEQWTAHRFPGSNGPYWSLGFEVWYYVAFGVFLFTRGVWRWIASIAVMAFIGPKVMLLYPLWLMGVTVYRICAVPFAARSGTGGILFASPLVLLVIYQFLPQPPLQAFTNVTLDVNRFWSLGQDYLVGILFSIHLIGFTAVSATFAPWLDKHAGVIRWISGATFSIYLTHLPIMHFLSAISPWPKSSPWTVVLLITIAPLACVAFAEVSERRKDSWRRLFMGFLRLGEAFLVSLRFRRP